MQHRQTMGLKVWFALGWVIFSAILLGCSASSKANERMAEEEYDRSHDKCWKLFSRIDPQLKKEYQDCMKQDGWLIK